MWCDDQATDSNQARCGVSGLREGRQVMTATPKERTTRKAQREAQVHNTQVAEAKKATRPGVVLHLTVSADGWVSLWDKSGMGGHGANVELLLTEDQADAVQSGMRATSQGISDGRLEAKWL
jgi:hypothetical protein